MLTAITREVSASIAQCELTHFPRVSLDVNRARAQHAEYEAALRRLGVQIIRAPAAPDLPDAVFVEDMAVILDEGAVITNPGAVSRLRETMGIAQVLIGFGWLQFIEQGTLDGGDVLRIAKTFYVGRTSRTNDAGIQSLERIVAPRGYQVHPVDVRGCLHLKSAVTQVAANMVLLNSAWLPFGAFADFDRIEVDASEPYGANALRINDAVIYPQHFPRTRARLESHGIQVHTVPCDELAKAEGAVTCCSLLLNYAPPVA